MAMRIDRLVQPQLYLRAIASLAISAPAWSNEETIDEIFKPAPLAGWRDHRGQHRRQRFGARRQGGRPRTRSRWAS
jgi:uncharacterized protein YfaP (DUF2135 family)